MATRGLQITESTEHAHLATLPDNRATRIAAIVARDWLTGRTRSETITVIPINVRISENHRRTATVTQQTLENGAVVADHVILAPAALSLIYEQTNAFNGREVAREAWESLKRLWKARKPFELVTEHEVYKDMVFETISALHQSPNRGGLQFTMELKQINFANLTYVKVPESAVSPAVAKTASTPVNAGMVTAPPAPSVDEVMTAKFGSDWNQAFTGGTKPSLTGDNWGSSQWP
jgi:hypothetical protein